MIRKIQTDPFVNDVAGKKARYTFRDVQNYILFSLLLREVGDNNGNPSALTDSVESIAFEFGNDEKITIENLDLHQKLQAFLNPTGDAQRTDSIFVDFASFASRNSPIGLGDVKTPSVAVKLKADAGNVVHDHLEMVPHYKLASTMQERGKMARLIEHTQTKVIQGWNIEKDFPIGELGTLSQLVIDSPNILEVRLFLGTELLIDEKVEHIDAAQKDSEFRKAQDGNQVIIDLESYNDAREALPLGSATFKLEYLYDTGEAAPAGGIDYLIRGYEA